MEASRPMVAQMVPYMHYDKTCKIWTMLCVI